MKFFNVFEFMGHNLWSDAQEIVGSLSNKINTLVSIGNDNFDTILRELNLKHEVESYYKAKAIDPALIAMIIQIVVPIVIEILKVVIPMIIDAFKKKPAEPTT